MALGIAVRVLIVFTLVNLSLAQWRQRSDRCVTPSLHGRVEMFVKSDANDLLQRMHLYMDYDKDGQRLTLNGTLTSGEYSTDFVAFFLYKEQVAIMAHPSQRRCQRTTLPEFRPPVPIPEGAKVIQKGYLGSLTNRLGTNTYGGFIARNMRYVTTIDMASCTPISSFLYQTGERGEHQIAYINYFELVEEPKTSSFDLPAYCNEGNADMERRQMPNLVPFPGKRQMPNMVPFAGKRQMPNMVPFAGKRQMPNMVPFAGKRQMPNMVPFAGKRQMPNMVPFAGKRQMPNMVPFAGKRQMPNLVPFGKRSSKKGRRQMPNQVPFPAGK